MPRRNSTVALLGRTSDSLRVQQSRSSQRLMLAVARGAGRTAPMAKAVQAPGSNISPIKVGPSVADVESAGGTVWTEHRPIQTGAELRFPPFAHRAFWLFGDRRRGRSVENAPPLSLGSGWDGIRIAVATVGMEHRPNQLRAECCRCAGDRRMTSVAAPAKVPR